MLSSRLRLASESHIAPSQSCYKQKACMYSVVQCCCTQSIVAWVWIHWLQDKPAVPELWIASQRVGQANLPLRHSCWIGSLRPGRGMNTQIKIEMPVRHSFDCFINRPKVSSHSNLPRRGYRCTEGSLLPYQWVHELRQLPFGGWYFKSFVLIHHISLCSRAILFGDV